MRAALIDNSTNIVVNIIVADPAVDPAPEGFTIIGLPDDSPVSIDWIYDPTVDEFTNPNPQPVDPGVN